MSELKKGWTRVAFGDIVRLCRDRSSRPAEDGYDRYVGLEHLEPGDLKLRRWGDVADGTTFTNVFHAGQVLFGKRRAYQRKVAVADFDGVCSGDIYVFESKSEHLIHELLPFICQTDGFFDHAVGTSAGSLSPRTNWDSLARYEFALPPLEEQRRIAEILIAAEKISQAYFYVAMKADDVYNSVLFEHFQGSDKGNLESTQANGKHYSKHPLTPLKDVLVSTQYGLSQPSSENGKYRMLRMMDIYEGVAIDENLCSVDLPEKEFLRYRLNKGDILFNRTNSHDLVGRTGVYALDGDHVFASYLVRIVADPSMLLSEYLSIFLNTPLGRRQVMQFATRGVSQTNVNVSNLQKVIIPLPDLNYQQRLIKTVNGIRHARTEFFCRSTEAKNIMRQIANKYLCEPQ